MDAVPEPTIHNVDRLIGLATPQSADQIRARVQDLIQDLPAGHALRTYGEERIAMLRGLASATSNDAAREPTIRDVDRLIGPVTPHFANQIRARVENLIQDLPAGHPVRDYGEERIAMLRGLSYATSKADSGDPSAPQ